MNLTHLQSLIILIYFGNKLITTAKIPTKYAAEIFKRNVNTEPAKPCHYKSNSDEAYNILSQIVNDFDEDKFDDHVTNKICKHIELWNRLGEIVKRVKDNCSAVRKSKNNNGQYDDSSNDDKDVGLDDNDDGSDDSKKHAIRRHKHYHKHSHKHKESHKHFHNSEGKPRNVDESADEYEYDGETSVPIKPKDKTSFIPDSDSIEKEPSRNESREEISGEEIIRIRESEAVIKNSNENDDIKSNKPKSITKGETTRKRRPKPETSEPETSVSVETTAKIHKPNNRKPEGEKLKNQKPKFETSDDDIQSSEDESRIPVRHYKEKKSKDRIDNNRNDGESSGKKTSRNKKIDTKESEIVHPNKTSEKDDDASDALALIVDKSNLQIACNRKRYPIYADSEACKAFHAQLSK